jgi:hypothetical protein
MKRLIIEHELCATSVSPRSEVTHRDNYNTGPSVKIASENGYYGTTNDDDSKGSALHRYLQNNLRLIL